MHYTFWKFKPQIPLCLDAALLGHFQRAFLGITAHLIAHLPMCEAKTGIHTCVLICKQFFLVLIPVEESHTSAQTNELIPEAVHARVGFSLKHKTGAMTTDNGSNVIFFEMTSKFFRWSAVLPTYCNCSFVLDCQQKQFTILNSWPRYDL